MLSPGGRSRRSLKERRPTVFGVDFCAHVRASKSNVPFVVSKCVAEIDERALDVKVNPKTFISRVSFPHLWIFLLCVQGIYRVSGVKSKVESVCQSFEVSGDAVDLSEENPHVIANVMKNYLRQVRATREF